MWSKGEIDGYAYCVKHYEVGSVYGVNSGRISKMELRKDGALLVNYDRAWDIPPLGDELVAVCEKLLRMYN